MRKKTRDLNEKIRAAIDEMAATVDSDSFIEPADIPSICKKYKQLASEVERKRSGIFYRLVTVNKNLKNNLDEFHDIYDHFPERVANHNTDLAHSLAPEVGSCINPIESFDLDEQQLTAIAYDVRSRLIIAGAGTGKTTTTVGFVKYLLATGKAQPDDILALSFTNESVDDLKKRIMAEAGQRVMVSTFHRLGLNIIASSNSVKPRITKVDLRHFVMEELERRRHDPKFIRNLNEFILYDYESVQDENQFEDSSKLIEYLKENPLITLNGEKVKSFGEADIANYLAINGIPYTYEDAYCVDTADSEYGQYHPDFHLNDTDIYIEYFGTDREGNVAKFMTDRDPNAAEEYRNGMEWKRRIHADNGTKLVELFAYERSEGTLLDKLESELEKRQIKTELASPEEIFDRTFKSDGRILNSITSTFTTALLLIKGYGKPWSEVYPEGNNHRDKKTLKRMEAVLKPIYDSYQSVLEENGEIDFEDMLNLAAQYVREGKYEHPYKYVIVDEYQDLSRSRYNLLKALRISKDYKLFCVGDD